MGHKQIVTRTQIAKMPGADATHFFEQPCWLCDKITW